MQTRFTLHDFTVIVLDDLDGSLAIVVGSFVFVANSGSDEGNRALAEAAIHLARRGE